MGNQQTREARASGSSEAQDPPRESTQHNNRFSRYIHSNTGQGPSRPDLARNRLSRIDISGFMQSHSASGSQVQTPAMPSTQPRMAEQTDAEPFQHKETKQEREARRRERHAAMRLIERELSMRMEGVDGGYLVTLGTYTRPEDFDKAVVRQLQIERKLAPFWKGIEDLDETWTDYQLVAAVRGLPVPNADDQPPKGFFTLPRFLPTTPDSPNPVTNPPSVPVPPGHDLLLPSSSSGLSASLAAAPRSSFPLRPRGARALAAAFSIGSSSKNTSEINIPLMRETMLPSDPFVDGKPMEAVLYRNATECPICFLNFPPFLNRTRCCSQPICSECFVQIKRPDPHPPEHHPGRPSDPAASSNEQQEGEEELVSEPSACPYCQQSELGVTYQPPPFRQGLVYVSGSNDSDAPSATPANAIMGSQSSPNSALNLVTSSPGKTRRRTCSLSANAPNVVSSDRIRPDWEIKLMAARMHRARRAAAATALHTAAFMTPPPSGWSRLGLFRRAADAGPSSSRHQVHGPEDESYGPSPPHPPHPPPHPFDRMEDLEAFILAEGIRQSLASKDTEDRKESKKKEKEERKAREREAREERKVQERKQKDERRAQRLQRDVYGDGTGTGASRSNLSLSLPFGRKRNHSSVGVTMQTQPGGHSHSHSHSQSVDKGKAREREWESDRERPASSVQLGQHPKQEVNAAGDGAMWSIQQGDNAERVRPSDGASVGGTLAESTASDSDDGQRGTDTADPPPPDYGAITEKLGFTLDNTLGPNDTPGSAMSNERQADQACQEEGVGITCVLPAPKLVVTPGTPAEESDVTADKQFGTSDMAHVVRSEEMSQ